MHLIRLILADLANGQSTADSLRMRLGIELSKCQQTLTDLTSEGFLQTKLISGFLKVYALTEKGRDALEKAEN